MLVMQDCHCREPAAGDLLEGKDPATINLTELATEGLLVVKGLKIFTPPIETQVKLVLTYIWSPAFHLLRTCQSWKMAGRLLLAPTG